MRRLDFVISLAALAVKNAADYREVGEHFDAVESIRRGVAQAKKGLGRSVDEVFDDLECES